jgi:hypothetical protein
VIIDAYSRVVTGFCAPGKASCNLTVVKLSALQHLPEIEKEDMIASAHALRRKETGPYFAYFTGFGQKFSAGLALPTLHTRMACHENG